MHNQCLAILKHSSAASCYVMDFQKNNNYTSWSEGNKVWLGLPSILANWEVFGQPLPGASLLIVEDKEISEQLSKYLGLDHLLHLFFLTSNNTFNSVTHRVQLLTTTQIHFSWFHYLNKLSSKYICYISLIHCLKQDGAFQLSVSSKKWIVKCL